MKTIKYPNVSTDGCRQKEADINLLNAEIIEMNAPSGEPVRKAGIAPQVLDELFDSIEEISAEEVDPVKVAVDLNRTEMDADNSMNASSTSYHLSSDSGSDSGSLIASKYVEPSNLTSKLLPNFT